LTIFDDFSLFRRIALGDIMYQGKRIQKKGSFIKTCARKVYKVFSILSTMAITTSILLYLGGKILSYNKSDDDLIIEDIAENLDKGYSIMDIIKTDLHGFGNESIIVITKEDICWDEFEAPRSQILFYDKIDNSILQTIYNLFGYGSEYSLKYKFALSGPDGYLGHIAEINDIIDANRDGRPEVVVTFQSTGFTGSGGGALVGIFSYSVQQRTYCLIGTYPCVNENTGYGEIINSLDNQEIEGFSNYYDDTFNFSLGMTSNRDNAFFFDTGYGVYFVQTWHTIADDESNADPHTHYIELYTVLNETFYSDELAFQYCYSGEIPGKREFCSTEFLIDYIYSNNLLSYCY